MSLRTTYTGTLDAKLAEAREAGRDWVLTTNVAAITSAITSAASSGKKSFTYTASAAFQPTDLRLLGPLWEAHKTGILQALAEEDLMFNEVSVELNTSDQTQTQIDVNFDF